METKVFVTRNVDCSTMTAEEFVNTMTADLNEAVKVYNEYYMPIYKERHQKYMMDYRKSTLNIATQFASKKWKTERKRQEYINKKMSEIVDKGFYFPNLTFFDMDLNPGTNGIPDACILRCGDRLSNENILGCYERIKDNKYFRKAIGWILEGYPCGRPQIRMILPDEVQAEFDNERKNLENAISNFYKGTRYFGD